MKLSQLFSVAIAIWSIMAGVCIADDLQTGFGGVAWSTSLKQIKDCESVDEKEGIQYCLRRNQPHTLLGEPVTNVLYGFYQDAFFAVFIRIENDEAYVQTKGRLMELLGTPETSLDKEGIAFTQRWTEDQVRVELFNDRSKQGFSLVYYYLPIANKAFRKHKALIPSKWPKIKLFPTEKGVDPEAIGILQF